MFKILVAEDDASTRLLLRAQLRRAGFEPVLAQDGAEALDLLGQTHVDLLVCDVMMPGIDGFELCRRIREGRCPGAASATPQTLPVLMLTARAEREDKREGFLVGTDDYLTKPFDEEELLFRIKALLRRARVVEERRLSVGEVVLDYDTHTVRLPDDLPQTLPPKEFNLLYKLLAYPGQTFTRRQLLDEIWGPGSESEERTVNVHVNRLRTRFWDRPEFQIQTVRGLGYRAVIAGAPAASEVRS